MNHQQRARKINLAAEAVFSKGVTEEEYDAIREAANYRPCAWCGDSYRWTLLSYTGPMTSRGDQYCDPQCVSKSERENAPLIKQQPRSINTDPALIGWV